MVRLFALLVACGLVWGAGQAQADNRLVKFPQITTKNLNERQATFPSGLPGKRAYVLVAFKREQQADLDVWIDKLELKKADAPAWIEMPVIADYGSLWRGFIDSGMRSGIKTKEARSRVFTVYGDRDKFMRTLKMQTADKVYVLVVQQDGRYSDGKADALRKAIAAQS